MVFWPVLCLWFSLTRGLPSPAEKCMHIDAAPINKEDLSQAESNGDITSLVSLKLTDPSDTTSLKELCDGIFEDISVKFNLNKKVSQHTVNPCKLQQHNCMIIDQSNQPIKFSCVLTISC